MKFHKNADSEIQKKWFVKQLKLAKKQTFSSYNKVEVKETTKSKEQVTKKLKDIENETS